ncbi:MAG TPA: GNAT family N-acetyltransferase [Streptosporangiaceae bacterium]|nr:GNAT family N-acetyltransferase [Streptosporangiaceae bacterium]
MIVPSDKDVVRNLLRLHVAANLGIYFDGIDELNGDLAYCWSDSITDYYWNYGFSFQADDLDGQQVQQITRVASSHGRQPALWQLADSDTPEGWSSVSDEAWMTLDLSAIQAIAAPSLEVTVELLETPTPAMVATFSDAYASDAGPGEVGYFALPPEYSNRFAVGRSRPPASSHVVGASVGGESVAVACICLVEDSVGLYSVATAHQWRRHGLGRYISAKSLQFARNMGASTAFLQTESNSAVEHMYSSLGFNRRFVGRLYSQM